MTEQKRASLTNAHGNQLLMTAWSLNGDLRATTFEAELEQTFVNNTGDHAEIVYRFPLPWGANLLGLEAKISDKRMTGLVCGKRESESSYEEALSEGDSAILLERSADYDYTLNLGGIKPNEQIVITIRYGQLLSFSKAGLRLCIPTVIAPRYGNPFGEGQLKTHETTETSGVAEHPFKLAITLHGKWADSGIESPSHNIKVGQAEHGVREVSLAKQSYLDRDFVLSLIQPELASIVTIAPDFLHEGERMILAAFRPSLMRADPKPVNVKILVDCSGSMAGDSIQAARRALQAFMSSLTEQDRFSLSKFGDKTEHRSKTLWKATEPCKLAALRWIASLNADLGGTEMAGALAEAFMLSSKSVSDVLLITDGDIHGVDEVIALAKKSGHRLFIVGIGSAPSESHLRRMAQATFGACDFVAAGEDVGPAITNMFGRLRASSVEDIKESWPDCCSVRWSSPMQQIAYNGDTIHAFARVSGDLAGELVLTGSNEDGFPIQIGTVSLSDAATTNNADLSRLAVSAYINQLVQNEKNQDDDGQRLAIGYQLVTPKTNLFMQIDRSEHKADVMPTLHKVAQMHPAGFGGFGSTIENTRTRPTITVIEPLFFRSASDPAPFADFGQYDLPAGFRSARHSAQNMPPFLRKQASEQWCYAAWRLDTHDARLFAHTQEFKGLTPLGVREWVRHTSAEKWPKKYADLAQMGVPWEVVEWLELLVALEAGAAEEAAVSSFLYAFVSQSVERALAKIILEYKGSRSADDDLPIEHDLDIINLNAFVFADVMRAIEGSVMGSWPLCVLDMAQPQ